jgi:hypothetical protein
MKSTNTTNEAKRASRGWSNDMSPEAVAGRLQKLAQLYRAWKQLNPNACSAARLPLRND